MSVDNFHKAANVRRTLLGAGMAAALLLVCASKGNAQSKAEQGASGPATKTVRIWDACDPASFDAKVGPGTCKPGHHGQTQFEDFFSEVESDQMAGGWRFNPLLNTSDGVLKLA